MTDDLNIKDPSTEKKKIKRQPEPPNVDYTFDEGYRDRVARAWEKTDPNSVFTWARAGTTDTILGRQRKAAVEEGGERIFDTMGDFLVKHSREVYEKRRKAEHKASLDAVQSVVGPEEELTFGDLQQQRQPRKPLDKPIEVKTD